MKTKMEKLSEDMSTLFGCSSSVADVDEINTFNCGFSGCDVCKACVYEHDREFRTHQYGYRESIRWDGMYTYFCPKGFTFGAFSSRTSKNSGIIMGPIIMGEYQDMLLVGESEEFYNAVLKINCISPEKLRVFNDVAIMAVRGASMTSPGEKYVYDQASFLNELYYIQEHQAYGEDDYSYIIKAEEDIKLLLKQNDKAGMKKLINELLGKIYFQSKYDLGEVKVRCIELVSVLSRTVVDAGVELNRVFPFNTNLLKQVTDIDSFEEMHRWLINILYTYMDTIFDFARIKHADTIYKAMSYIRENWRNKPTLDDIAHNSHMSKSYLSTLFKQEIGMSITEIINEMRIEHSKKLLTTTDMSIAAIAVECGFYDQSYYTKVFQKAAGVSPKKYRANRISA